MLRLEVRADTVTDPKLHRQGDHTRAALREERGGCLPILAQAGLCISPDTPLTTAPTPPGPPVSQSQDAVCSVSQGLPRLQPLPPATLTYSSSPYLVPLSLWVPHIPPVSTFLVSLESVPSSLSSLLLSQELGQSRTVVRSSGSGVNPT